MPNMFSLLRGHEPQAEQGHRHERHRVQHDRRATAASFEAPKNVVTAKRNAS